MSSIPIHISVPQRYGLIKHGYNLECAWVLKYTGMHVVFFMDIGSVFTGNEWKKLADKTVLR